MLGVVVLLVIMAKHSRLPLPAYRPFISGTVGFIIAPKADKYLSVFEANVRAGSVHGSIYTCMHGPTDTCLICRSMGRCVDRMGSGRLLLREAGSSCKL